MHANARRCLMQVYKQRSEEYGPIYKETFGVISTIVISDLDEYEKVIAVDGRYPNRIELTPIVHYRRKRGMSLGIVNGLSTTLLTVCVCVSVCMCVCVCVCICVLYYNVIYKQRYCTVRRRDSCCSLSGDDRSFGHHELKTSLYRPIA